jgi:hypothetical protein
MAVAGVTLFGGIDGRASIVAFTSAVIWLALDTANGLFSKSIVVRIVFNTACIIYFYYVYASRRVRRRSEFDAVPVTSTDSEGGGSVSDDVDPLSSVPRVATSFPLSHHHIVSCTPLRRPGKLTCL